MRLSYIKTIPKPTNQTMNTPTPTPRTDACAKNIDQSNFEDSWKDDFEEFAWVTADFARTLERELTAVTEQRDRLKEELKETKKHFKDANRGAEINAHALRINADKLISVTEQRDGFKKELEIANLRLKGKRHPDDNGIMADGEIDVKAVTEQRDRLAEECAKIRDVAERAIDYLDQSYRDGFSDEVSELRYELAAVKGGSDEIPR